ncbi:MAG: DUF885 domain-containing protein [Oscillospiraceae bacterium]|nr:DUF885 domain-containing protein [Oscillospiraceae bacterium]
MKKTLRNIIALLLVLSFSIGILAGCTYILRPGNEEVQDSVVEQESIVEQQESIIEDQDERESLTEAQILVNQEDFDILMDELFEDWVTSDTISMNFTLADPEAMGIERPEVTFGTITSQESIEDSRQDTINLSNQLDDFVRAYLRYDQRIVYDILRRSLLLSEIMGEDDDFFYVTGIIRPMNGLQVQLPILLAEFNFYTVEDIEIYLELLADTYRYFDEIIEFERERSRRGLFLNDANVDSVIESIESFIESPEDNLLITIFNDRIENYYGLTDEQRERFMQENEYQVLNNVIRAYESLLEAMQELRGVGARSGGLANLPGGVEYAHALLRHRIGTDKSIEELGEVLSTWLQDTWSTAFEILQNNPELDERFRNGTAGQIDDMPVEQQIFKLRSQMMRDFPQIEGETGLSVVEVHESLQDHLGPAFFLVPAVDRFNENVVYMNPASTDDNLFFFTVLAHESYPGHMYQNVYFRYQFPHPIRFALSNIGYSEGWATYAEMFSYFFAGIGEEEATLFWSDRFLNMLMVSHIDFGVNLLGWDMEDVAEFLTIFGITDMDPAERMYNRVTAVPLNSLFYTLGFIEIIELRVEAENTLRSDFNLLDFHTFILDIGPAPFPIINERMLNRIDSTGTLAPAA